MAIVNSSLNFYRKKCTIWTLFGLKVLKFPCNISEIYNKLFKRRLWTYMASSIFVVRFGQLRKSLEKIVPRNRAGNVFIHE